MSPPRRCTGIPPVDVPSLDMVGKSPAPGNLSLSVSRIEQPPPHPHLSLRDWNSVRIRITHSPSQRTEEAKIQSFGERLHSLSELPFHSFTYFSPSLVITVSRSTNSPFVAIFGFEKTVLFLIPHLTSSGTKLGCWLLFSQHRTTSTATPIVKGFGADGVRIGIHQRGIRTHS